MARNRTHVEATPESVWGVIADGTTYSDWVVGSRAVHEVEAGWPEPGVKIHHSVGLGPLAWADDTKVLECERVRRILLEARLRPFATAKVELHLEPRGGGTRVTIDEEVVAGPLSHIPAAVQAVPMKARNALTLRRLKRLAEGRR